jgi:hypothetical protein
LLARSLKKAERAGLSHSPDVFLERVREQQEEQMSKWNVATTAGVVAVGDLKQSSSSNNMAYSNPYANRGAVPPSTTDTFSYSQPGLMGRLGFSNKAPEIDTEAYVGMMVNHKLTPPQTAHFWARAKAEFAYAV